MEYPSIECNISRDVLQSFLIPVVRAGYTATIDLEVFDRPYSEEPDEIEIPGVISKYHGMTIQEIMAKIDSNALKNYGVFASITPPDAQHVIAVGGIYPILNKNDFKCMIHRDDPYLMDILLASGFKYAGESACKWKDSNKVFALSLDALKSLTNYLTNNKVNYSNTDDFICYFGGQYPAFVLKDLWSSCYLLSGEAIDSKTKQTVYWVALENPSRLKAHLPKSFDRVSALLIGCGAQEINCSLSQ
jgi:hypothetical protein